MIAPFDVVVTVAQQNDAAVAEAGEQVYRRLLEAGIDVIIDDGPAGGREVQRRRLVGIRCGSPSASAAWPPAPPTDRARHCRDRVVPLDDIPEHVRKAVARALTA